MMDKEQVPCPWCEHHAAVNYDNPAAQAPSPSCFRCNGIGVVDVGGSDFAVDAACGRCGGTARQRPVACQFPAVTL